MKGFHAAILAASMLIVPLAGAQRASAVHNGQQAAGIWLGLLDAGQYGAAWDEAANRLQRAVPRAEWIARVRALRAPHGPVRARRLKWVNYPETIAAEGGQYVVLEYETRFDNTVSAVETVTPVMDERGIWKVGAYSIR